jgi:hypothetical protein
MGGKSAIQQPYRPEGDIFGDYDWASVYANPEYSAYVPRWDEKSGEYHYGSVIPVDEDDAYELGLPKMSYLHLKRADHSTFYKAVRAEENLGRTTIKKGARRYAVPTEYENPITRTKRKLKGEI